MKASRQVTVVVSLLLVGCVATSVLLLRRLDQLRTGATLEEVLYISSPKALKKMSLGYDGLLADIYWTRAVQYFGSKHHEGAQDFALLAPLLEITTTLDPHLLVAYEYGSNFLAPPPPSGGGMPERAIDLEEFGIRHNPNEWRLYYNEGFIRYMELKDYAGAAAVFARGARVPNAHPFLAILAGNMAEHAGDQQMARMMWSTTYQSSKDNNVRANAAAHLRALQVEDAVTELEALAARYRQQTGRFPVSFSELQAAGLLPGTPIDPLGHSYKLMPGGRVEVRVPDDLPFIRKGTPAGYVPPASPKFLPAD
jgi:tetratricopeptide (TPR) repeat protein